jgi:hypothetical protein
LVDESIRISTSAGFDAATNPLTEKAYSRIDLIPVWFLVKLLIVIIDILNFKVHSVKKCF